MKEKQLFITTFMFLLLTISYSCNRSKNERGQDALFLLDNLELSTQTMIEQSKYLFQNLESNLTKDNYNHELDFLYPQAEVAYSVSKNIHQSIVNVQKKFPISDNDEKATDLYENLNLFKKQLANTDQLFREENIKLMTSLGLIGENKSESKTDFLKRLSESTEKEYKTILVKLNNSVAILENKLLTYYNMKGLNQVNVKFDYVAGLVSQNYKYLKQGDTLEIIAGVGAFSRAAEPSVIINGTDIQVNHGIGKFKFKVDGVQGMNVLPVYIQYKDQDGMNQSSKFPVVYYINE